MKAILIAASLFTVIPSCLADGSRYVTITSTNINTAETLQIQSGETASIVSVVNAQRFPGTTIDPDGSGYYTRTKILSLAQGNTFKVDIGNTLVGPATISFYPSWTYDSGQKNSSATCFTVKITPPTYDVNKTLILPPGTNQVAIALETSTNLVNWSTATNGVYGSPDEARFFRIHMQTQ